MEWIFALVSVGGAIGYAVLLGRGIEHRKRWALEIARAIGTLECSWGERIARDIPDSPPAAEQGPEPDGELTQLAA